MDCSHKTFSPYEARVANFDQPAPWYITFRGMCLLPVLLLVLFFAHSGQAAPLRALSNPPTITPIADQLVNLNTPTSALSFMVSDDVTPPSALTVTGVSSQPTLFPTIRIVLGGNGAARTVTVRPAANQSGSAIIILTVKDADGLTATTSFTVTVNAPPTITPITNQLINMGASTSALAFTVGDDLTLNTSLTVTGVSSNTALVKTANIVVTGPNADGRCSVIVTPVAIYSGVTTIHLTVTDGGGLTAQTSFILTVNGRPIFTPIARQLINLNTSTPALAFTVSDDLTPVESLLVTGASNNSTLFPPIRIALGGSGAARTVTVRPGLNQSGTATITISAKDGGGLTGTMSFIVTVNGPPTISTIANQLINMGTSTSALAFKVGDDVTVAGALTVTGAASNAALVKTANIVLTGPDVSGQCSVTITPVAIYSGVTTITLTVTDGGGLTTKGSFILTVNGRPKVTSIANQLVIPGTTPAALPFILSDDLTPVWLLSVKGASNNTALIPTSNIVFTGPNVDGFCTVTVTPVDDQLGAATITLSVTDGGGLTTTISFTYTVDVLASSTPFVVFGGGAGITNQGVYTVVHGDIGSTSVSTKITGFHDSTGDGYTETPLNKGYVTGRVYTDAPPPVIFAPGGPYGGTTVTMQIATAAAADTLTAYNYLAGLPTTAPDPSASGALGGETVPPGVYKAAGDTYSILPATTLTLDAQGNSNAVWVFQMGSSLTVGAIGAGATPAKVLFKNGIGQAKNVYWVVGSGATINTGATMVGTIIASAGVTLSTSGQVILTTLNGRALSLNASVTMVNTVINKP